MVDPVALRTLPLPRPGSSFARAERLLALHWRWVCAEDAGDVDGTGKSAGALQAFPIFVANQKPWVSCRFFPKLITARFQMPPETMKSTIMVRSCLLQKRLLACS
jgi:hypothetical protein